MSQRAKRGAKATPRAHTMRFCIGPYRFTTRVTLTAIGGIAYADGRAAELRVARELVRRGALSQRSRRGRAAVALFFRKALGLRQEELADDLGVTVEDVAAWEEGQQVPASCSLSIATTIMAPEIAEHWKAATRKRPTPPASVIALRD